MDSDNKKRAKIHCADDAWRVYYNIYDKLCIDRYYNSHLKSRLHITNSCEKQLNNTSMNNYN